MIKSRNKKAKHYVDNEKFYHALREYFIICDKVEGEWNAIHGIEKQKLLDSGVRPKKIFDHLPKIMWPRVTEYLGKTMFDIAKYSNDMPNFFSYSYKDEMIGDGYEDCILRIKTFNIDQGLLKVYRMSLEEGVRDKLLFTEGTRDLFYKQLQAHSIQIDLDEFESSIKNKFSAEVTYGDIKIKIGRNPFAYFTTACYYASVRRIKKEKKQSMVRSEMIKNSGVLSDMESSTQSGDTASYGNSYLSFLQENMGGSPSLPQPKQKIHKRTTKAYQRKIEEIENPIEVLMNDDAYYNSLENE